jgi:hypothetical protein
MPIGTFTGCYYDGQLPEPRRRLGSIGTPVSDVLACKPIYSFGLPAVWSTASQVKYYSGTAVDIHGNAIGDRYPSNDFKGVAIDPEDPPTFESQATYLKRLGLFLAGEERRPKKADWGARALALPFSRFSQQSTKLIDLLSHVDRVRLQHF